MLRRGLVLSAVAACFAVVPALTGSAQAGPLPERICETVDGHQICIYLIPTGSPTDSQEPGSITYSGQPQ